MKARLREGVQAWQQLPRRDRQLCVALAVFLAGVLAVYGLWQPAQQRLQTAQALYYKNLALAGDIQRARPVKPMKVPDQPLPTRLSESAVAAGLNVEQFEMDTDVLRVTVSAEAGALLTWLARIEHEGAEFQSLHLEKRDRLLEARLVIKRV